MGNRRKTAPLRVHGWGPAAMGLGLTLGLMGVGPCAYTGGTPRCSGSSTLSGGSCVTSQPTFTYTPVPIVSPTPGDEAMAQTGFVLGGGPYFTGPNSTNNPRSFSGGAFENFIAAAIAPNQTNCGSMITAVGVTQNGSGALVPLIARYDSMGNLDTGFNGGLGYLMGSDIGPAGGTTSLLWAVAIDSSCRIVVAGESTSDTLGTQYQQAWIARYSSAGVLDTTFGEPINSDASVRLGLVLEPVITLSTNGTPVRGFLVGATRYQYNAFKTLALDANDGIFAAGYAGQLSMANVLLSSLPLIVKVDSDGDYEYNTTTSTYWGQTNHSTQIYGTTYTWGYVITSMGLGATFETLTDSLYNATADRLTLTANNMSDLYSSDVGTRGALYQVVATTGAASTDLGGSFVVQGVANSNYRAIARRASDGAFIAGGTVHDMAQFCTMPATALVSNSGLIESFSTAGAALTSYTLPVGTVHLPAASYWPAQWSAAVCTSDQFYPYDRIHDIAYDNTLDAVVAVGWSNHSGPTSAAAVNITSSSLTSWPSFSRAAFVLRTNSALTGLDASFGSADTPALDGINLSPAYGFGAQGSTTHNGVDGLNSVVLDPVEGFIYGVGYSLIPAAGGATSPNTVVPLVVRWVGTDGDFHN